MAAGIITKTITVASGVTIPVQFYVDDTVSPTTWTPVHLLIKSDGTIADPTLFAQGDGKTLADLYTVLGSPFQANAASRFGITNPTSVLTRVSDTNNYAQNDLIATDTTAGSVVVPSITVARVASGSFTIPRARLYTGKTSGWDQVLLRVRLWTTAPTYTNGDNGAYAVATGAAGFLGLFDFALSQFADGAAATGVASSGAIPAIALASGQVIYWDLQYIGSAALAPASAQTFTFVPEIQQN